LELALPVELVLVLAVVASALVVEALELALEVVVSVLVAWALELELVVEALELAAAAVAVPAALALRSQLLKICAVPRRLRRA